MISIDELLVGLVAGTGFIIGLVGATMIGVMVAQQIGQANSPTLPALPSPNQRSEFRMPNKYRAMNFVRDEKGFIRAVEVLE